MNEAENDVVHRLALRDCDREREERDPALGVERAVDWVDDHDRQPRTAHAANLLRDDCARRVPHAGEDGLLRSLIDRGGLVTAEAFPYYGLALDARGQSREHRVDIRDRGPAELQPVSQA